MTGIVMRGQMLVAVPEEVMKKLGLQPYQQITMGQMVQIAQESVNLCEEKLDDLVIGAEFIGDKDAG